MYKNKDFDYDLWKDDNGKCYARVRSTGEVSLIVPKADLIAVSLTKPHIPNLLKTI